MTRQMSPDARYVLAVLARSPIRVPEIDVRLVHDLVDGPPEHTEQVLDELLAAGELRPAWTAGVWALTGTPSADDALAEGRTARRGHDPTEVLLAWLVGVAVEADHTVSPLSWRLAKPAGPTSWPFGGRRGAVAWWELHRAELLTFLQDLLDRRLWRLTWTLAEALWGLGRATGYAQVQITSQRIGLLAIVNDHENAVDPDAERARAYLLRRAVFSTRLAFGLSDAGEHVLAVRAADQGVETAKQAGDPIALAAALSTRARTVLAARAVDRVEDGIRDARQALVLDDAHEYLRGAGLRHRRLGELYALAGRVPDALMEFSVAVDLLDRAGDAVGRAVVQAITGHVLVGAGRATDALTPLRTALTTFADVGTAGQLGHAYHGLGLAALALGGRETARLYLTSAEQHYENGNLGDRADDVRHLLDTTLAEDVS
ncbi:hypothetical protein ACFXGA_27105 [Actinosynnema sp. NPDC059335]|uniref:hypothetical protein n=1 Tax=Actinosynnema sp. NPDC059335 TaxID=3346804 RepID=UPI00366C02C0